MQFGSSETDTGQRIPLAQFDKVVLYLYVTSVLVDNFVVLPSTSYDSYFKHLNVKETSMALSSYKY